MLGPARCSGQLQPCSNHFILCSLLHDHYKAWWGSGWACLRDHSGQLAAAPGNREVPKKLGCSPSLRLASPGLLPSQDMGPVPASHPATALRPDSCRDSATASAQPPVHPVLHVENTQPSQALEPGHLPLKDSSPALPHAHPVPRRPGELFRCAFESPPTRCAVMRIR